jgi:hypothetical protein
MSSLAPLALPESPEQIESTAHHAAEVQHMVNDIGYLLTSVDANRIGQLSFAVNDIPYHVTHKKGNADGESRICIQAVLGYLPFSIEAGDRRLALLTILQASHALFNVRFGMDHHNRIFAAGNFTTDTLSAPDFIFYPLTRFLQEAQPFIDLIGEYL